MNKIGEELRKFFKEQNLTQKEVALKAGLPPSYITKIYKGERGFGKEMAEKWQTLFGLSKTYLLTGEGEMLIDNKDRSVPYYMYQDLLKERDTWRDRSKEQERYIEELESRLSKYEDVGKKEVVNS